MNITSYPKDMEYDYEFNVIKLVGGHYEWVASFENADEAYNLAESNSEYIVAHNVRIRHKRKKND